jgi:hypothetical protein
MHDVQQAAILCSVDDLIQRVGLLRVPRVALQHCLERNVLGTEEMTLVQRSWNAQECINSISSIDAVNRHDVRHLHLCLATAGPCVGGSSAAASRLIAKQEQEAM